MTNKIIFAKTNSYMQDSFFTFQEFFGNDVGKNQLSKETLYYNIQPGFKNNWKYVELFRKPNRQFVFIKNLAAIEKNEPFPFLIQSGNSSCSVNFQIIIEWLDNKTDIVLCGLNINEKIDKSDICNNVGYFARQDADIIDIESSKFVSINPILHPINEQASNFLVMPLFYIVKIKGTNIYCLFFEESIISFSGSGLGIEYHNEVMDFELIKGYEETFTDFLCVPEIKNHEALIDKNIYFTKNCIIDIFGHEIGRINRYKVDTSNLDISVITNCKHEIIKPGCYKIIDINGSLGYFKIELNVGNYWVFSKRDNFTFEYSLFRI